MSLSISVSYWNDPAARRAKRLFQMAHELHKIGYQGLRVSFGSSPSGTYYRIHFFPYTILDQDNLNRCYFELEEMEDLLSKRDRWQSIFDSLGIFDCADYQRIFSNQIDSWQFVTNKLDSFQASYSSSESNRYFGWDDGPNKNARQLANKFINYFPEICKLSFVEDWRYSGWFTRLLGMVENGYFPYAYRGDQVDISKSKGIYLSKHHGIARDHTSDFNRFVYPPKPSVRASSSIKKNTID